MSILPAVFIDIETGGLLEEHPITQIACIAVDPAWNETDVFEAKIKVDVMKCHPDALVRNHYSDAVWSETAKDAPVVARDLAVWLEKHAHMPMLSKEGRPYKMARLVGHNVAAFDMPRVRMFMEVNYKKFWKGCWWYPLDTYQQALWFFSTHPQFPPPPNYQLSSLAGYFGLETPNAHDALADVRTCAAVCRFFLEAR